MSEPEKESPETLDNNLVDIEAEVIQLLQGARAQWMARYPWPEWWNHVHGELAFVDLSLSSRTKKPEFRPFAIRGIVESGLFSWTRTQIALFDEGNVVWKDEDIRTVVPIKIEFWRIAIGEEPARPLTHPPKAKPFNPSLISIEELKAILVDLKSVTDVRQPNLGSLAEWIRGKFLSCAEGIVSVAEYSLSSSVQEGLPDHEQFVRSLLALRQVSELIKKAIGIGSGQTESVSTEELVEIILLKEEVNRKITKMEKDYFESLPENERF